MTDLPALSKALDDPFPGIPTDWDDKPEPDSKTKPEPKKKPEPIPKPTPRNMWTNAATVEKDLLEGVEFLAGGLMLVPGALGQDGQLLYERLPTVVHELVELGKADKRLRVFLERLSMPGKYGPLIGAIFPIVLGIAANHNLLPASLLGVARDTETGGEK